MRQLIEDHIPHASAQRTAPPIMEATNLDGLPAVNPIRPAPAFATAAPFQVASVKSDQKPKLEL